MKKLIAILALLTLAFTFGCRTSGAIEVDDDDYGMLNSTVVAGVQQPGA